MFQYGQASAPAAKRYVVWTEGMCKDKNGAAPIIDVPGWIVSRCSANGAGDEASVNGNGAASRVLSEGATAIPIGAGTA